MCLQYFNFSVLYAKHIFPTVSFFFFLSFSFANVRRFAKYTTLKQPKQTGAKCCYVLASIERVQAHTHRMRYTDTDTVRFEPESETQCFKLEEKCYAKNMQNFVIRISSMISILCRLFALSDAHRIS